MLRFYKKALLALLAAFIVSALLTYICVQRTFTSAVLLPSGDSQFNWQAAVETDVYQGGQSAAVLQDDRFSLDFSMQISDAVQYPFASVALQFNGVNGQPEPVDLTRFSEISFSVKCSPANVILFSVLTFEEGVSRSGDYLSYRSPNSYFSCDPQWSQVTLDLTRLETPQWWLEQFNLKLSMTDYQLNQVPKLVFGSSYQSPPSVESRVQINGLTLKGRDWFYLYLLAAILVLRWLAVAVGLWREHARALTQSLRLKLQQDRPLVAYQQLSVEPRSDVEKDTIVRYLATEYANSDLNLDAVVQGTGVGRTKINNILKSELGYTFTGYLNKLRLTEAARLLSQGGDSNVSEIAYSVGYKNVSYFNKLFKEEYGCTPKSFKGIYKSSTADKQ